MKSRISGFTLIEIITVVLVLGILLAIAVPNIIKYRETSRAKACKVNLRTILAAVEEARLERDKDTLDAIEGGDMDVLRDKYLPGQLLECKSGGSYSVEYNADTDTYTPVCSSGKDGHDLSD